MTWKWPWLVTIIILCFNQCYPVLLLEQLKPVILLTPFDGYVKISFHRAKVEEIDLENKKVKIVEKDITRQHWLEFDHLVFAMGLSTDMSRVPGMSEHSLPMRTLGDAIFLRNEIINKLEMAAIESNPFKKRKLLSFVFVGGGFSGVETMGEVFDMIHTALKKITQPFRKMMSD